MSLKDILVQLDTTEQSASRLELAADLARRFGAHLTGLHVIDFARPAALALETAAFVDAQQMDDLMERLRTASSDRAAKVEAEFRARIERDGIAGEWRLVDGEVAPTIALHARYADLAVVGQVDPDHPDRGGGRHVVDQALLASGRPVLVVPYAGKFASVGRNVLVGWNASRESARALNDALPILQKAETVTVLAVNARGGIAGEGALPAADIALHLARHGIKVSAAHSSVTEIGEGDELLNRAFESGADLLVVGGYGHSRARELVLGGVTRSLLMHMTVPVLMSH